MAIYRLLICAPPVDQLPRAIVCQPKSDPCRENGGRQITKAQLYKERYLAHSIDFRDIFGEIASKHLHNTNLASLLPGHSHTALNFI
jgi:hypothetical protein